MQSRVRDIFSFYQQSKSFAKEVKEYTKTNLRYVATAGALIVASYGTHSLFKNLSLPQKNELLYQSMSPVLSEIQQQWAFRLLVKWGITEFAEDTSDYVPQLIDSTQFLAQQKMMQEIQHEEYIRDSIKQEYLNSLNHFELIQKVVDYKASRKDRVYEIMKFRNQWTNEKGFQYIPLPNTANRGNKDLVFKDVVGVGHFLLDSDISLNQKEIAYDINKNQNHYIHQYNQKYIEIAKKLDQYVPTFEREDERIRLHYKKYSELTQTDVIVSPLRQYYFDDIAFAVTRKNEQFKTAHEVTLAKGRHNPYKDNQGTNLIFTGDKKSYSQFSGGSVVFIFHDAYGNRIIRDFAGSINDIQKEGESINKEFKLKSHDLTIGIHDIGSFSAKPYAKDFIYHSSQASGYNPDPWTGGGLLIPLKQE